MAERARVIILGGGIAGAATFALLARQTGVDVRLLEARAALGTGTTAKNNGRCHSGASGVFSDPPRITERKQQGSALLRRLPIPWQNVSRALYLCADEEQEALFAAACAARGVALERPPEGAGRHWIRHEQVRRAFLVDEPCFDPVALTDALAAAGHAQGGTVHYRHRAEEIRPRGDVLEVAGPGFAMEADLVLDLTSKYGGSARVAGRPPLVEIGWFRWPIMALPATALPPLDRVITSMDAAAHVPSVIPHGAWVTFDCKTAPEQVPDPDSYPAVNPAPLRWNDQERQILAGTAAFPPLAELANGPLRDEIRVFYGVQGRRSGAPQDSDLCRTFAFPDVPGYVLRNGGLATTALLDAIETVEDACERLNRPPPDRQDALDRLAVLLGDHSATGASRMIYAG